MKPHPTITQRIVANPWVVGRVTPFAPRLPPARAKFPRRRLPDPLPIKTLLEFPGPTSEFGFKGPTDYYLVRLWGMALDWWIDGLMDWWIGGIGGLPRIAERERLGSWFGTQTLSSHRNRVLPIFSTLIYLDLP